MQKYKSYFRSLFIALLVGFLLDALAPRLTFGGVVLCVLAIIGLFELVKDQIRDEVRSAIRDDAELQHEETRVWLRDWFDHDMSHTITSVPFDPNHPHPWVAFEQKFGKKTKPGQESKG